MEENKNLNPETPNMEEAVSQYSALTSSNNSLAESLKKDAATYDVKKVERNAKISKTIVSVVIYAFLFFLALIVIFPFYWMITGAFKTTAEITVFPPLWFPSSFSFANFVEAFQRAPFLNYFLNSVIALCGSVGICFFTTIVGAFAFSKLNFPFKNVLLGLMLGLMMVPFEMIVITNFRTIIDLGLYDNISSYCIHQL